MVIVLKTDELIKRIKTISHDEVAEIADIEARYRAEAGTEKMGEINNCIADAYARLLSACRRFLSSTSMEGRDNVTTIPAQYSFEFALSERRSLGKADALAEAMNTFMVEHALSKFYSMVGQSELSNKHSLAAIDAGNQIDTALYTKLPPRV